MAARWAEEKTAFLLRVEEGLSWLERDLEWTPEDSIRKGSYRNPVEFGFSNALALMLTGHRPEAERCLNQVVNILEAFFAHHQDNGHWASSLLRRDMLIYRFHCEWLLYGRREPGYLARALEALTEAEQRAIAVGIELGETGYEMMAHLSLLLGNGSTALEALPRAVDRPAALDLAGVARGKPTRIKTLGLAAHYLLDPAAIPADQVRQRIAAGVTAVMKEEFAKIAPDPRDILLWLDLPNVLFGQTADPWAMLAQVNEMVGD